MLYAVSELEQGLLTTLAVDGDGGLRPIGQLPTGGSHPCWVTTDPDGSVLLIANYASGSAAVVGLDAAGQPARRPVLLQHDGSGPVPDRQEGPHVHQVLPTTRGHVLATDLGTDRIAVYRVNAGPAGHGGPPELTVEQVHSVVMPAGSGTRHIALSADGATGYVSGELDGSVTVIRREPPGTSPDAWVVQRQVPSSGRGPAQPSQLLLAGGDRWLLVANRGPDTLAVLDVADGLAVRQELSTGAQPRYFVIVGDRVLVACQQGNQVDAFALDAADGSLTPLGPLEEGSGIAGSPFRTPTCVAPLPPDRLG